MHLHTDGPRDGVALRVGWPSGGLPPLAAKDVLVIVWLAVVNTALAFTLWNRSLRTLTAVESSVINNSMLIQVGVLAWIFLGEGFGPRQGVGLALAALGTMLVQLRAGKQTPGSPQPEA
jgi:drug/metabolite transporter (DMT)-like permease